MHAGTRNVHAPRRAEQDARDTACEASTPTTSTTTYDLPKGVEEDATDARLRHAAQRLLLETNTVGEGPARAHAQPAAVCGRGCNRMRQRLQPYVTEAVTCEAGEMQLSAAR